MTIQWQDILAVAGGARRLRRAVVLLACVAVCGWTLLSATHLHAHHDADARDHGALACLVCAAMPVGAAPPVILRAPVPAPQVAGAVVFSVYTPPASTAPSAYLSRAPPAA